MILFPIFIHIQEKSEEERRKEFERELHEYVLRREEEAMKERIERDKRLKKEMEEEKLRRKLNVEYDIKRAANPWDYSFLPEGWSIFGTPLQIIEEY